MSLLATLKQQIRVKFPNNVDRDEWRFSRYGLLTALQRMSESPQSIITNEIKQKALESEGLAMKIPVYSIGNVTVGNVRSCQIGGFENTTDVVDVTWVTLVTDISMKKSQYSVNETSYLQDLNKKLLSVDNAMAKALEQYVYTKLDTEKSTVHNSALLGAGGYPVVGGVIQVPSADQEYFFNEIEAIMQGDDFYSDTYSVLGSTTLMPKVRHWGNQGGGNDENLSYQFGAFDFTFSNRYILGGGEKAGGFILQEGTIGLISRLAEDAKAKSKTTQGTEWGETFFPTLGYTVGTMYTSSCEDLSGDQGLEHLKATVVEKWQFSVDIAIITQYNSDPVAKAGGIKKFAFVA